MRLFWGRRYPLKRDENGRSARQRAFDLFGTGQRPAEVCKTIPVSLRTACRYYEDFKKLHHKVPYSMIRKWMRENPEFSDKVIDMLATSLEMPREEVIVRMQKPWGLLQVMKGEWPNYRLERQRTGIEERLLAALQVIQFADRFGHTEPRLVMETLSELMIDKSEEPLSNRDD